MFFVELSFYHAAAVLSLANAICTGGKSFKNKWIGKVPSTLHTVLHLNRFLSVKNI